MIEPKKYDPRVRTGGLEVPPGKDGKPLRWPSGWIRYRGRYRMPDGTKPGRNVPEEHCYSEARAREHVASVQQKLDAKMLEPTFVAPPIDEDKTVKKYSERWTKAREARGLASVADDRSRLATHILPTLGPKDMREVTRDDLEALVEKLDGKVRAGELSWKTTTHVWGLVTRMFADACNAKQRDLRVRADNPALLVHGPDRGPSKAKVYLYPSEFLAMVSHADVPHEWKRMFAITTYLYARAGEVNALTWDDVDLERRIVHIHASANRRTGKVTTTKTENTRRVPIDPELLPLLTAMHAETNGKGRVSPIDATDKKLSRQLQRCLHLAKVKRADLFADDASRKPMTFHDLRATGITWCAVRGDDALKIRQRAGHSTFSTTEGYIREAENFSDAAFGTPFPPLPPALLGLASQAGETAADAVTPIEKLEPPQTTGPEAAQVYEMFVEAPGIEPYRRHFLKQAMSLVFRRNGLISRRVHGER